MIQSKDREILVERYLRGLLNLWELAEVEKEIKNNAEFAAYVDFERNIQLGIRESKKAQFKEQLNKLDLNKKVILPFTTKKPNFGQYSIAATVVLIIGFTFTTLYIMSTPTHSDSRVSHSSIAKFEKGLSLLTK